MYKDSARQQLPKGHSSLASIKGTCASMTPEQQRVHFRDPPQSDPSETGSQTSAGASEASWIKVKTEKKEAKKGAL